MWLGSKVADGVDWVGEGVASVIGLDDSRFQDVLDNMTEEEMAAAEAVNKEREQEYRDHGLLLDDSVPAEEVEDEGFWLSTKKNKEVAPATVDEEAGGDDGVEMSDQNTTADSGSADAVPSVADHGTSGGGSSTATKGPGQYEAVDVNDVHLMA